MATLSAGHLFTDIAQGSIPALLPFLIAQDHLNYAAASALVLAATISSSIDPAGVRPHLRPPLAAVADAARAGARWAGRGARRPGADVSADVRRGRAQRDRRRGLPPRGLEVRQLRVGRPARERHEPVQRRRQRRLRAGPGAGHAAGGPVRAARHRVRADADVVDGGRADPRAAAPEALPHRRRRRTRASRRRARGTGGRSRCWRR